MYAHTALSLIHDKYLLFWQTLLASFVAIRSLG